MKNFRKIALALTVGVLAIGFSAFTSASSKNAKFNPVYYGLNQAGTLYTKAMSDPSIHCNDDTDLDDCAISYPIAHGNSFTPAARPAGFTVVSGPGWVNP